MQLHPKKRTSQTKGKNKKSQGTYSVADAGSTILARFESVDQGDDDARAGVADSMAEGDSAAEWTSGGEEDGGSGTDAYPLTLTFAGSSWQTFSAMRTTTENASFNSKREMSSVVRPAFFKAMGSATVGASGKSMGSTPASAHAVVCE